MNKEIQMRYSVINWSAKADDHSLRRINILFEIILSSRSMVNSIVIRHDLRSGNSPDLIFIIKI